MPSCVNSHPPGLQNNICALQLLRQLREGHSLVLLGYTEGRGRYPPRPLAAASQLPLLQPCGTAASAPPQQGSPQQQRYVLWADDAPGALAADLSCLPALLTTPALQRVVPLACALAALRGGGSGTSGGTSSGSGAAAASSRGEPLLVRGRLQRVALSVRRVHAACGRPVSCVSFARSQEEEGAQGCSAGEMEGSPGSQVADPASLQGAGGCGGQGGDEGAECGAAEGGDGSLWECGFCGLEVGGREVEVACYEGSALLTAEAGEDGGSMGQGGSEVAVSLEAAACTALAGMPAASFRRLPAQQRAELVAGLQGASCLACVCCPTAAVQGLALSMLLRL